MARQNPVATLRSLNIPALLGSACLWAWMGNLYASSFFAPLGAPAMMAEIATWATFALVVPLSALFLVRSTLIRKLIVQPGALIGSGAVGTVGSLLFVGAAHRASWVLLGLGAALNALFMATAILAWGAVYCKRGTTTATLYVTGGFTCSFIPSALSMLMAPLASAFVPTALPLLANVFLVAVPSPERTYDQRQAPDPAPRPTSLANAIPRFLGISAPVVCALALIMLGLGYMQHHISFTDFPDLATPNGGAPLQLVRGLAALVLFAVMLLAPRRAPLVYRIGLLAIVAGFSLMPFLYGTEQFWIAGAVMTAGYVTFDVLIWIVIAQVAYTGLSDPFRVTCAIRVLVSSLFCTLGGLLGIALSSIAEHAPFAYADAVLMGYLMTIAVVLVLSSPAVWELFDARPVTPSTAPSPEAAIQSLATIWGLTDREREVFGLLAVGRTQPWVAEHLGISESTVNSHVRHIYGKAGVNSRQDLLDLVVCAQSPEVVEKPSEPPQKHTV